jgi:protein TonB
MNTIWRIISIVSFGILVHQIFFEKSDEEMVEFQVAEFDKNRPVFYIVEEMPCFPGCENKGFSNAERQSCANGKMLEFVFSNLKYPTSDNYNQVKGVAPVQFTVEKDGSLTHIKMLKSLSPGLGNEIVKVIKMMPRWVPGKQFGKEVAVRFTLPIKIKLE